MNQDYVIAVDLGASGGKMAAARIEQDKIQVLDTWLIENSPVDLNGNLYWDIFGIYKAILKGLAFFASRYGPARSIGIDSWGSTYGFLDKKGRLAEPVCRVIYLARSATPARSKAPSCLLSPTRPAWTPGRWSSRPPPMIRRLPLPPFPVLTSRAFSSVSEPT